MNSRQYAVGSRQKSSIDDGLNSAHRLPPTTRHRGFSLVELLIVVGIIVLVIAMAVPAFNLLNGTRSVDAAENLLGVMLARARTEAIGVQQTRGVMFYIDPVTQRVHVALVRQVDPPGLPQNPAPADGAFKIYDVDVYLDLVSEGDAVPLPQGIGVQVVDDAVLAGTLPNLVRQDDAYIGYNRRHGDGVLLPTSPAYGGVVLFDSRGQLVSRSYAFRCRSNHAAVPYFTPMGILLYQPDIAALIVRPYDIVPVLDVNRGTQRSAVGLIVYDSEQFSGNDDNKLDDPQVDTTLGTYASTPEPAEEAWLDQFGTSLLVNRYNGTLVKGE